MVVPAKSEPETHPTCATGANEKEIATQDQARQTHAGEVGSLDGEQHSGQSEGGSTQDEQPTTPRVHGQPDAQIQLPAQVQAQHLSMLMMMQQQHLAAQAQAQAQGCTAPLAPYGVPMFRPSGPISQEAESPDGQTTKLAGNEQPGDFAGTQNAAPTAMVSQNDQMAPTHGEKREAHSTPSTDMANHAQVFERAQAAAYQQAAVASRFMPLPSTAAPGSATAAQIPPMDATKAAELPTGHPASLRATTPTSNLPLARSFRGCGPMVHFSAVAAAARAGRQSGGVAGGQPCGYPHSLAAFPSAMGMATLQAFMQKNRQPGAAQTGAQAKEKTAEPEQQRRKKRKSPKPPNARDGRWTEEEHALFMQGMSIYGRSWTKVAQVVGTRTTVQVRSHAQKYEMKMERRKDERNGLRQPRGRRNVAKGKVASGCTTSSGTSSGTQQGLTSTADTMARASTDADAQSDCCAVADADTTQLNLHKSMSFETLQGEERGSGDLVVQARAGEPGHDGDRDQLDMLIAERNVPDHPLLLATLSEPDVRNQNLVSAAALGQDIPADLDLKMEMEIEMGLGMELDMHTQQNEIGNRIDELPFEFGIAGIDVATSEPFVPSAISRHSGGETRGHVAGQFRDPSDSMGIGEDGDAYAKAPILHAVSLPDQANYVPTSMASGSYAFSMEEADWLSSSNGQYREEAPCPPNVCESVVECTRTGLSSDQLLESSRGQGNGRAPTGSTRGANSIRQPQVLVRTSGTRNECQVASGEVETGTQSKQRGTIQVKAEPGAHQASKTMGQHRLSAMRTSRSAETVRHALPRRTFGGGEVEAHQHVGCLAQALGKEGTFAHEMHYPQACTDDTGIFPMRMAMDMDIGLASTSFPTFDLPVGKDNGHASFAAAAWETDSFKPWYAATGTTTNQDRLQVSQTEAVVIESLKSDEYHRCTGGERRLHSNSMEYEVLNYPEAPSSGTETTMEQRGSESDASIVTTPDMTLFLAPQKVL